MRVFFYLLYHQLAWAYDFVANVVSLGHWLDWIGSIIPELGGPRVLEIGHGPGHLQKLLGEMKIDHYGIDESRQMGRIASWRLGKTIEGTRIIRSHTQQLPFGGGTFDRVAATFPSEYILDPHTLSETYRVLNPGGKFIILPGAWFKGNRWFERTAAWFFKVTGQSPDWNTEFLTPFFDAGFVIESRRIENPAWSLLLIIAEKPDEKHTIFK